MADSPNQPQFLSVVLRPNLTFRSTIVYRFGVQTLRAGVSSYSGAGG
jgi:hypothetical protein